jgi:hypothetical protein
MIEVLNKKTFVFWFWIFFVFQKVKIQIGGIKFFYHSGIKLFCRRTSPTVSSP